MSLNLRSNTSPYWNLVRKQSYNYRGVYLAETDQAYIKGEFEEIRDYDNIDDYQCMMLALDKLDFYHKPLVIDYYLNGLTFVQMNKKYGISLANLKKAVNEGINIIREHCKKIIY
jgi:DNA-directed RNA polymerase specialized sigma24 family protein